MCRWLQQGSNGEQKLVEGAAEAKASPPGAGGMVALAVAGVAVAVMSMAHTYARQQSRFPSIPARSVLGARTKAGPDDPLILTAGTLYY